MRSRERFLIFARRAAATVGPAQGAQLAVVGGLDPQAQPVHPRPPQGAQRPPVPGAVRVGLHGDLRVTGQAVVSADGFQNLPQTPRPQAGGGAGLRQLEAEGGDVAVHLVLRPRQGVEVAVDALAFAEGDVDIQSQGLVLLFHAYHLGGKLSPIVPESGAIRKGRIRCFSAASRRNRAEGPR